MKKPTRNEMAEALADLAFRPEAEPDEVPEGWLTAAGWHEVFSGQDGDTPAPSTLAKRIRDLVRAGQWETKTFRIRSASKMYPVPHYRKKR